MNDPLLQSLRHEQIHLRLQVDDLGRRIEALASRKIMPVPISEPRAVPSPAPLPTLPLSAFPPPIPAAPRESFELHLGRVWLVRIGIGMLLTGLIFLASFTYQRFIGYVTPFGRAAAFFTVSLGLAGLGLWLERSRETLRYYGRVLAAGGLAGGYYALYASHYVPAMHWIDGNLVSNFLLMAWAGVIIGVACWRRAETLGVAAIALAYYTSLLGPDSSYTFVSNLILAGASVFLTLRYGWKFVSYASLAGTYGTYACSRLGDWAPAATGDAAVVTGYWAIFTFAILWPKVGSWEKRERLSLLTLNNACYLLLGAFALTGHFEQTFADFAMVFGLALVGTAFLSRRCRPDDGAQETAFFVQGILVATLGWLSRWHGPSGALVLGVESALLLSTSAWRHSTPLRALACMAATVACGWAGWTCLDDDEWRGQAVPLLVAAIFAGEAFFLNRARNRTGEEVRSAGFFAGLATLLYLLWIWKRVPEAQQFWVLAASGAGVYTLQFVHPARFVNWIAMIFGGMAAFVFALTYHQAERIFWANGLAFAGLFALEQFASRRGAADLLSREGQVLWLSFVFLGSWMFLGETAAALQPGWSPTLVWAVIAGGLFALGLACRERVARWWGLGILAAALGRVLLVDVWQLGTLSRILTFLGLGTILLGLGFVYNRYQEAIKKWL